MADLEALSTLGSTPCPGDAPTGISARYEPEFETLQLEIDKLGSLSEDQPHWRVVVDLSSGIIRDKSKDLLAAAYLCAGLLDQAGYAGLVTGLEITKDMVGTFWDDLFPPAAKMRRRESAVRWLDERLALNVEALPDPGEADRAVLERCASAVEALSDLLREKFPDGTGLGDLPRAIREKQSTIPEAEAPPAPAAEAQAPAASGDDEDEWVTAPQPIVEEGEWVGAPSGGESGGGATAGPGTIDSEDSALEAALAAVDYLRGADPTDPRPYQILRAAIWSQHREIDADAGGQASFAGGDDDALAAWDESLRKKKFAEVLEEAEARVRSEPLWLDPNLVVVRAMEGMGHEYEGARLAVEGEVGAFVHRLPELLDLRFEDGTPFAAEPTRLWIRNEIFSASAGVAGETGDSSEARLAEASKEAGKLASRKKLGPAVEVFQKGMAGVAAGRDRFLWRLDLARIFVEAGQHELALPQLESLHEETARHHLEAWEPRLEVEVVSLLWQCYTAAPSDGSSAEKAKALHARLCRLDVAAALALDGKKR